MMIHNDLFMRVAVSRGCLQEGVLSPLLWCLFVDDLMARLNVVCVSTQGYADDICLLAVGKFPNSVRSRAVNSKVKKAHHLLLACRRAYGAMLGLTPKVVYWLYFSIIRPPSPLHL
jgi:hypothetical protein